jgi:hypothetical protein
LSEETTSKVLKPNNLAQPVAAKDFN